MKFTQKMARHLNGGAKFSQLIFYIFADGKPCGITRVTTTDGSPRYTKTVDKFTCGDEKFDVLATRGVGMQAWLESHAKVEA